MPKTLPLALAILATACVGQPLVAPTPVTFHSSRSPADVTRGAAVALVDAGFRVTQTDSLGYALTATRAATHNGNADFVTCNMPSGSAAAANRETTLTILLRSVAAAAGSDVTIGSSVKTDFPGYEGTAIQVPAADSLCVSRGTMERRLEAALR